MAGSMNTMVPVGLLSWVLLALAGCGGGGGGSGSGSASSPVSTPVPTVFASSPGGVFNESQVVTLTASSGATIFFTLDGSVPSDSTSQYSEPLTLVTDVTLSAIAIDALDQTSDILRVTFEFDFDAPSGFSLEAPTSVISASNADGFGLSIVRGELASRYAIEIDDEDAATSVVSLSGQITQSFSQELTADLSSLAGGDVSAVLTLTDPAGNLSDPYRLQLQKVSDLASARVGGSVNIASGTQSDLDVNEESVSNVSNDSFDAAQEIFAPGVLGGYVNETFTGASGSLFSSGDEDFFLVSLMAGDDIRLTIAESGADLDVELYDSSRLLVDDSLGAGNTESMTAPSDGDFYIRVFPFFGASNYVLSLGEAIGTNVASRSLEHMSSFDEFQPNQVVMRFNDKGDQVMASLHSSMGVVGGGQLDQPVLKAFNGVASRDAVIVTANQQLHSKRAVATGKARQRAKQETIWAIKALGKKPVLPLQNQIIGANRWLCPMTPYTPNNGTIRKFSSPMLGMSPPAAQM